MEVRKFSLINEKGEEFSLMDVHNYCLLTDPAGLGYGYETDYEKVGNVFIENIRTLEQGTFTGTVNTIGYNNYAKLVNFIENSANLKLYYVIPYPNQETKEYYRDVEFRNITKSEIQRNGVISEEIEFECLSLWYSINEANYYIEAGEKEIRWNFEWDSRFLSYNARSLSIVNNGHTEAAIKLSIDGEVVNPVLGLSVEGQQVQTIPFTCSIQEFEKFEYSSKDGDSYVRKKNTDGTYTSLFNLNVLEFNNNNVLKLPKGKSCEIQLTADDDIQKAKLQVFIYYKSV